METIHLMLGQSTVWQILTSLWQQTFSHNSIFQTGCAYFLAEFFSMRMSPAISLNEYHCFWIMIRVKNSQDLKIDMYWTFSKIEQLKNFLCCDSSQTSMHLICWIDYSEKFNYWYVRLYIFGFVLPGEGQLRPLWSLWAGDGDRDSARESRGSPGLRVREPTWSTPPPGLEGRDPLPSPRPTGLDRGDSDDVGEKFPPVEPPPSDLLSELSASLAGDVWLPEPGALWDDGGDENPDDLPPVTFFDVNVSDNFNALLTLSNAAVW